ncbi:efflux RND transporter periplasmic adaptor subunit [Aureitalea sp. L0-47]|uniref:efflux RND transporter periplasmic adaptor subunit n=1 Tax=Aureitalea sp. L0-47 TaxID=2816962 RepID=UPI0022370D88|nr:efflux RND transporter periplasmic adaptor subunit [Aureitalea sp. L0-47]MCW5518234.1 efflux RND transporter periplasmic adaptor subunit [Aureitalea sp. L0-47]
MLPRIIISILVLSLFVACGKNKEQQSPDETNSNEGDAFSEIRVTSTQFQTGQMELGSPKEMDFPRYIRTSGIIDAPPANKAVISALGGGHIKEILLLVGDKVKKGQRLLTIENPEYIRLQQEFLDASEQLSFLENEYERQKTLYDERITSQKNYLKAEADYKRNLAVYNTLDKQLRMLNIDPVGVMNGRIVSSVGIYAPISGTVTKISANKGSYVTPTDEIMRLVNSDHVHLELEVFERDAMDVKEGQHIEFYFPERSTESYSGEVHLVGAQIDEVKRTTKVHGHFEKSDSLNFSVGMFIEAAIKTGEIKRLSLPETAIITKEDNTYVLKVIEQNSQEYSFELVAVVVIETSNGHSAIQPTDRLKPTDKCLVKGGYGLTVD